MDRMADPCENVYLPLRSVMTIEVSAVEVTDASAHVNRSLVAIEPILFLQRIRLQPGPGFNNHLFAIKLIYSNVRL